MSELETVPPSDPVENELISPEPELLIKAREDLSEGVRTELNRLEQEVLKDNEDMTAEDWERELDQMREGEIDYLERQVQNPDPEIAQRAEFVLKIKKDLDTLVDDVNKDVMSGDLEVAQEKVQKFLGVTREYLESLPLEGTDIEAALEQMDFLIQLDLTMVQVGEEARSKLLMLTSLGIDMVPLVGGAKMMTEAGFGKTLDGQDLAGIKRVLHFGEGAFWELVDVASIALLFAGGTGAATEGAAMAAKGAKAAGTASKAAKAGRFSESVIRGGALLGKHSIPGAKGMVRAGKFLENNKKVARVLDTTYDTQKAVRKGLEVKEIVESGKEGLSKYQQQIELLNQINAQREELTDLLENMAGQLPE
jgi:hypothetical protein